MTPFQSYYSFFTLLIGLAVAAVARGFGTLWQTRQRTRVGYLTPLLAAFLLLDMSRFWLALWARQEIAPLGPVALASILCVTLPYVFVTTIIFPDDVAEWQSLDDYYDAHSRVIFCALLVSKVAGYAADGVLFKTSLRVHDLPGIALVVVPLALLAVFGRRSIHRIGLAMLTLWSAFIFVALD